MSPQGAVLSHKRKVQGKANALCCFAVVIYAACVCRGVVEVVALLGSVQRDLCGSSTARAIVYQVAAADEDKPRPIGLFGYIFATYYAECSKILKCNDFIQR